MNLKFTNTTGNSDGVYTGLSVGTYTVTVTDANGCSVVTAGVSLSAPVAIGITASVTGVVSCNGATDGIIGGSVSGGTSGYTIEILNSSGGIAASLTQGATAYSFSGLGADSYTVRVTDVNGCSIVSSSVVLSEPLTLTSSGLLSNAVSCNGDSDGALTVTVSGGTGPYSYVLVEDNSNTSGDSDGNYTGLVAGDYTVTVTDSRSCTSTTGTISISDPVALTASSAITSVYNGEDISCNGASDGVA